MQFPKTQEYIKHNYVMLKEVWVPVFVKSVYYTFFLPTLIFGPVFGPESCSGLSAEFMFVFFKNLPMTITKIFQCITNSSYEYFIFA